MSKKPKSKLSKSPLKNSINHTDLSEKEKGTVSNPRQKKTPKFFFYIFMFLIPLLFFVILELALRLFNYGQEITQWTEIAPGKLALNPDIAYRYFHSTKNIPYSNQNSFDAVKKDNSFRIFILGGSSAAGYPYTPNGDFGKYLQKKLEVIYPEKTIEVVNIALTATNSYTIRDLIGGVIEQKPDLVLIYAGHNEYYGALGVGSMESIGRSRKIVKLMLSLEKYKTINLLRDVLKWIGGIFSSGDDNLGKESGTLMSRMAKDKLIAYNSEIFEEGILQFKDNLTDVIKLCKEAKVPILLSTLTCNLKDQKPFVNIEEESNPPADKIYEEAKQTLSEGNYNEALKKFVYAKDLDGLRFRAPQKINEVIFELAKEFNFPVVDVYNKFNEISPNGIVGDSLMTDHLHPTYDGYLLIGSLFFEELEKNNLLPPKDRLGAAKSNVEIERMLQPKLKISALDSVIAKYRIIILQNDWPFSERKSVEQMLKLFNRQNYIDSAALYVIDNKISWERAHRDVAMYYLRNGDYQNFIHEVNVLIWQYPFIEEYYSVASEQLLNAKLYEEAFPFLSEGFKLFPNAFYAKWLGIILLSKGNADQSIVYLNKSLDYKSNDAQVFFNLSGAYFNKGMYKEALSSIQNCLKLNSSYPQAANFKYQLEQKLKQIK